MNKLQRLQKSLPGFFKPEVNQFWKTLLTSWANELDDVEVQIDEAKKQLYITLASGNYLDDDARNLGVYRPTSIINAEGSKEFIPAINDDTFRTFIPLFSFAPKQIRDTMMKALDIFWGPTYSRVNIISNNAEYYDMSVARKLNITVDRNKEISIIFNPTDFDNSAQVTVEEIVDVINSKTSYIVALLYTDIVTSLNYIQIYTQTVGLRGSLEVNWVEQKLYYSPLAGTFEINDVITSSSGATATVVNVKNDHLVITQLSDSINSTETIAGSLSGASATITADLIPNDANSIFDFSTDVAESIKVAIHEINNKEIIIKVPESIPIILDSLKGSHHFQPTTTQLLTTSVDSIGLNSYLKGYALDDFTEKNSIGGPHGSGPSYFSYPSGLISDDEFIYIVDNDNTRIVKRSLIDLSYIGEGNSFLAITPIMPIGITADSTYLYFTDTARHEVVKIDKNFGYIDRHGTLGSGINNFHSPTGIVEKNGFLFVCDTRNHRIVKLDVGGLVYVIDAGTLGSGNNNFNAPSAITADDTYLYISDYNNDRIIKRRQDTLAYVSQASITDCAAIFYDSENDKLILSDWIDGLNETVRVWDTDLAEQANYTLYNLGDIAMCGMSTASGTNTIVIYPEWPGSFLYDPDGITANFELTDKICELNQTILKNDSYILLTVDDTSLLDDSGYFVINFGKSTQEIFIPYVEVINSTTVKLNPSYKFTENHYAGEKINVIYKGACIPRTTGEDYAVYMINPNIAEFLVKQLIELLKAAGVKLTFDIDYTDYLHEDLTNM